VAVRRWSTSIKRNSPPAGRYLEEARKFNVPITFAHQSLSQLDESLQTAATGAGTIVVFRVSGEDSRVLAASFDATPTQEQTGVEPIRAPVTDVVSHLLRRGHTNSIVAKFIADYLMPFDSLIKSCAHSNQMFQLGCVNLTSTDVIQGQQFLNSSLYQCMQTGRADIFVEPLALFTLGGAVDGGITYVFYDHLKRKFASGSEFLGFEQSARVFGEARLLNNTKSMDYLLKAHAKKKIWNDIFVYRIVHPGPAFLRMLRALRETMAILAKEPILVDTGQYQPVYRQRTYPDMSAQIANELSQQENYMARVKTLIGEYTIRTNPLSSRMTEAQLTARIRQIKEHIREQGLCRPAHEVEEEVRIRHERLRERHAAPPPSHTNGANRRRYRPRPPAAHT
jgi:hypothetical protein